MSSYRTSLLSSEYVADHTIAVRVAKPPGFEFTAGQFADLVLLNPPCHDLWGNLRTLSIASAPFQPYLEFLMRVSSTTFKQVLGTASPGMLVEVIGPAGNFHLHADAKRPAVFIAGGVGIAPFLSILRQAAYDRAQHHFYCFYSNRQSADAAYLGELRQASLPNCHLIPTITAGRPEGGAETGRITPSLLRRYLLPEARPVYYLAGPSQFVSGMISTLTAVDVGEADLQVEDFGEF